MLGIERDGPTARIAFSQRVQTEIVEQTLAIERGCCSFFTLHYDPAQRLLAIATDTEHNDGLSALINTLTPDGHSDDMSPTPSPTTNQRRGHRTPR